MSDAQAIPGPKQINAPCGKCGGGLMDILGLGWRYEQGADGLRSIVIQRLQCAECGARCQRDAPPRRDWSV